MTAPLPVIILLISSVGWGLTWIPLDYLGDIGVDGPLLILIAFGGAAILLFPMLMKQRQLWMPSWQWLLLIFIFGGFANMAFQASLFHGEVIRVMILFYLLPVWGVLGGRIFLGEHIDRLRVFAVILALTGAFLILDGPQIFEKPPSWIDMLAIASGFAFAMNNLVFRFAQEIPVASKVSAMFVGAVLFIAIYLFGYSSGTINITATGAGLTLVYGIFWLTLITFGTQWGVTRLEAGRASIIIVMELVAAVISAVILLPESLEYLEVIGIMMVISAALLEGLREGVTTAAT